MQTIRDFDFATVICDGCGRREDSKTADDERLHDYADLIEWKLDDMGWEQCDEENEDKWFCPDCASDEKHRTHPGEGRVIVEKAPLFELRCDLCGKVLVYDVFSEEPTFFKDAAGQVFRALFVNSPYDFVVFSAILNMNIAVFAEQIVRKLCAEFPE